MDNDQILELSAEFASLGAELHGAGDRESALMRIVELAVKHIEGCGWASITLVQGAKCRSLVSTDVIASNVDSIQHELHEGPCVQAAERDTDYVMFDVETEPRWPNFTRMLADNSPVRSVLALQLVAQESAALNLYGAAAGAFSTESVDMAAVFAAHASSLVALSEAEEQATNLAAALLSNRQIGVALGVLMAHRKITQDEAFTLLRTSSQSLHLKLRDIAAEVVETGTLPDRS
jgi:AmiR/NasT family two-component response regulator